MRSERLYLTAIGPFDEVTLSFPRGTDPTLADVYLLTGPNGCGKSTVLYAIAELLSQGVAALGRDLVIPRMRTMAAVAAMEVGNLDASGPIRYGLLPAQRSQRQMPDPFDVLSSVEEPQQSPFANSLSFTNTADTRILANWIANQHFKRLKAKDAGKLERAEQLGRSVHDIERVIAEIVEDPEFAFVTSDEDSNIRVRYQGRTIDLGLLPDGLKSIVSWIADLLMRLDRIPWVDDTPPLERPFLLLLDEIDIHLHPSWQRKVLPVAQRMFPNAQIIASTHSPFVVASAGDAHIITFAVSNGVSTVENTAPSQTGVSYSSVLRAIFGITSEFDIETENLFTAFHEAKSRLYAGDTSARTKVNDLAAKLAARSEEVGQLVAIELRQLDRQLAQRIAK
jgi:predicted ATP-binding protein involved in virulence